MSDEVVTIRNRGIDITHACIEVILDNSPPGDRTKIENIKQIIRAQSLAADEAEESVALRLFFSAYKAYIEFVEKQTSCQIVSKTADPKPN